MADTNEPGANASALEELTSAETTRIVLARLSQRNIKGYPDHVRLMGPRRRPAVVIRQGKLIAGSCSGKNPSKPQY